MRTVQKTSQQSISNFIDKTYTILENFDISNIICWAPKGVSFVIKDVKRFQNEILPIYFKHSNFSSFVRQLNMYSFHKVRGDPLDCQFEHEKFKRGCRQLLSKIKRKQSQGTILSQGIIEDQHPGAYPQESSENMKLLSQINHQTDSRLNIESMMSPKAKIQQVIHSWVKLEKFEPRIENNERNQQEFETLRIQNKRLKALKQNCLLKQKIIISADSQGVGEKFFKLITCLIAEKLQKQKNSFQRSVSDYKSKESSEKSITFDQVIEHVLSNTQTPLQYLGYSETARAISQFQSDQNFMLRKTHNLVSLSSSSSRPSQEFKIEQKII